MRFTINPAKRLSGYLILPGDKSISHRAIMLGSIADGTSNIKNILNSDDIETTVTAFRSLGVEIKQNSSETIITGRGPFLSAPSSELFMRDSGTTMRVIMGILAGQPFRSVLTASEGLSKRPMKRVTEPLSLMGAKIEGKDNANYAPVTIHGGKLKAIDQILKIASAQVKSAILLAGLYTDGETSVTEPSKSRDHTERMLKAYGAEVAIDGLKVSVKGVGRLRSQRIDVPGDISSAAFFIVGASLLKGSSVVLKSVGINPTRTGLIDILKMMGATIKIDNVREIASEPVGDIHVESSNLHGVTIEGRMIPRAIDELPVIMVAAAYADGATVIKQAGELRVKETDRINSMATNLTRMGANLSIEGEEIVIEGARNLKGITADSFGDHRTAMSMAIAGLAAQGETLIDDIDCISKSYPDFIKHLESLLR